jgi:FkbM family methyltransferase
MTNSILVAWNKLIFCWKITADTPSFFRLIRASKNFSINRDRDFASVEADQYLVNIASRKKLITLRRFSGDLDIFFEIFWKHCYAVTQPDEKRISSVLDLGANTGMSAAYFYSCFPEAEFYCVEPDPENAAILKANLSGLIPDANLHILEAAVGSSDTAGQLVTARYAYNSTVIAEPGKGGVKVVTMSTLLFYFDLQKIDLVKIDIEGAETSVFEDAEWLGNIHFIFIEFHSEQGLKSGLAKLESAGFKWKNCIGNSMLIFAENTEWKN